MRARDTTVAAFELLRGHAAAAKVWMARNVSCSLAARSVAEHQTWSRAYPRMNAKVVEMKE